LLKFKRDAAPWAVLALIGLITVWRIFIFYRLDDSFYRIYFAFDTRADELFIGCFLALSKNQIAKFPVLARLWPIAAVVIALSALKLGLKGPGQPYIDCVGFSVLAAATACVIVTLAEKSKSILGSVLAFPLMVGLGRISYAFYLWHYMIFREPGLSHALIPRTLEVFLLTLLASLASYYFVELPFRYSKPAYQLDKITIRFAGERHVDTYHRNGAELPDHESH
jgi:peptidoglycan/LPS O-acetylase OafA/YrhL